MPPVTDGSERFLQLLGQIVHGIHSLSDEYVYLLTPGKHRFQCNKILVTQGVCLMINGCFEE